MLSRLKKIKIHENNIYIYILLIKTKSKRRRLSFVDEKVLSKQYFPIPLYFPAKQTEQWALMLVSITKGKFYLQLT